MKRIHGYLRYVYEGAAESGNLLLTRFAEAVTARFSKIFMRGIPLEFLLCHPVQIILVSVQTTPLFFMGWRGLFLT